MFLNILDTICTIANLCCIYACIMNIYYHILGQHRECICQCLPCKGYRTAHNKGNGRILF